MENQLTVNIRNERQIGRQLGLYSSTIAFASLLGYSVVQILQIVGLVKFPTDAYLIYGFSLGIAAPYLIAVIALHHLLVPEKRIWSHTAIAFAIMYATYVSLNYVVQIATVIPATLDGSLKEIRVLDQTPHSLFWDVDALGYICMGFSTFFLVFAFSKEWKWLRIFLFANGLMVPVISFVYFYPYYSNKILLIGLPWIITAPGSLLLLAIFFKSEKGFRDELQ